MATAPTSEQGRVVDTGTVGNGLLPWGHFHDGSEYVPELQWPGNVQVYDRMIADSQVSSLVRSVVLPLTQRDWAIDPNNADPDSVQRLADELDLPVMGQDRGPRRRQRNRFSFTNHLTDALRSLSYGHYFFEQVGSIEGGRWVLRKLAPRPPRTIYEMNVAEDGGLVSIKQALGFDAPELSIDRLVCYVWDQEAGNWAGRAMIRPLYKNWLIKDRLMRVDAIKHERGANGAPLFEAPPGATPEQIAEIARLAQQQRITERGGGAVPSGTKQIGNAGPNATDTVASIRLHNEEMAGAFLAMFKQLGQTQTGSRALGETFVDVWSLALDAVAEWFIDIFTQHVIEDWYDFNYGEDSQAARLTIEEEPQPAADIAPLQDAVNNGDVQVSPEDASQVGVQPPPAQASRVRGGTQGRRRRSRESKAEVSVDSPSVPLPPRALRRQPYAHEVRATTDYAAIDASLNAHVDTATQAIRAAQAAQIDELHDAIVSAGGDLKNLSRLSASPVAESAILSAMRATAEMGIDSAASEANRQGIVSPLRPTLDELEARLGARAVATDRFLASGISDAAVRHALRLSAPNASAADVAGQVKAHLKGLSDKYIRDQMNGALTQAMNDGRRATMNRNKPTRIYSSELLDDNTCENCTAIDGTEYSSVDDTFDDYPTGGYFDCLGMERCRGTLVAVYGETA